MWSLGECGSLQGVREAIRDFADARGWTGPFHKPRSLALAFMGEVGECCEIVQWKGASDDYLKEAEVTHMGEELSDVTIYISRLADRCGIDLNAAVLEHLGCTVDEDAATQHGGSVEQKHGEDEGEDVVAVLANPDQEWVSCSLERIRSIVADRWMSAQEKDVHTPGLDRTRTLSLALVVAAGRLAAHFENGNETTHPVGLATLWPAARLNAMATDMARCVRVIVKMAIVSDVDLPDALRRKWEQNRAKYPVSLSKGRSDKYTAYMEQRAQWKAAAASKNRQQHQTASSDQASTVEDSDSGTSSSSASCSSSVGLRIAAHVAGLALGAVLALAWMGLPLQDSSSTKPINRR